jgi:hypothetical protein
MVNRICWKCGTRNPTFKEYLSKSEFNVALTGLASGTRVLLVNEAYYSGTWSTLAPDTPGKEVLVEAASPIGGVSYNFRSSSETTRCSLFAAAFVQELTVSPEGNIRGTYIKNCSGNAARCEHSKHPLRSPVAPGVSGVLIYPTLFSRHRS